MALAIQLPAFCPEVLATMSPYCRRCQVEMNERPGLPGCYVCPVNPEHTYEVEPEGGGPPDGGGPARRLRVCEPITEVIKQSILVERAYGYAAGHVVPLDRWQAHCAALERKQAQRLNGPLPQVPQCNASEEYSIMNGPPAPGGGGSKSGRRRKKSKGGKTYVDTPYGSEGSTNGRK